MKKLAFTKSEQTTLGVELEFQIIDPCSYDLASHAKDLIRQVRSHQNIIKPEITQSMIEINSSIHTTPQQLFEELITLKDFIKSQGDKLEILFCGGGTHPFEKWSLQKIFPTGRFRHLSRKYRYLSKCSTVFGQHIHVGCKNAEDSLYLTHAISRYVPQFIAISGSSPFYQGVDTGFDSTRSTIFSSFPSSGVIPYLTSWEEFSAYFYKIRRLGIVKTMKDFYWDVRPKPEFGTVEIRVCDTPLTIKKAVMIAAYAQALAAYILEERRFVLTRDLYHLYGYNKFQASRYGLKGHFFNPENLEPSFLYDDILATIKQIKKYADYFKSGDLISALSADILKKHNDAAFIRKIAKEKQSLPRLVHEQCKLWSKEELC